MSRWFNKLPGFRKTPAGLERVILRELPRATLLGTGALLLPSLLVRLLEWQAPALESAGGLAMLDVYVISLVVLHWTVMLTVGIGAFIVMVMKGPAYVADPYPLQESELRPPGD
ncbi:MAG: hypothetical protein RLZZ555_1830 [Pseudomonadota bacterium]|jgi:hypothetical protein